MPASDAEFADAAIAAVAWKLEVSPKGKDLVLRALVGIRGLNELKQMGSSAGPLLGFAVCLCPKKHLPSSGANRTQGPKNFRGKIAHRLWRLLGASAFSCSSGALTILVTVRKALWMTLLCRAQTPGDVWLLAAGAIAKPGSNAASGVLRGSSQGCWRGHRKVSGMAHPNMVNVLIALPASWAVHKFVTLFRHGSGLTSPTIIQALRQSHVELLRFGVSVRGCGAGAPQV